MNPKELNYKHPLITLGLYNKIEVLKNISKHTTRLFKIHNKNKIMTIDLIKTVYMLILYIHLNRK
jgi:hypothetical protein